MASNNRIIIRGARENNLKNVSLRIPKNKITVFTGVSGSGKSSLVFNTIAAESQRQLNETFPPFIRHRLPHYGQPDADFLENLSPAIIIDQKRIGGNQRSTVGTVTDIYTLLRLLFSRIGKPFVGHSEVFSFNHPNGMCSECEGLGKVFAIDIDRLFDKNKSLNEGAILFPTFAPGTVRWKRYVCTGLFDNDKKLSGYSEKEWHNLLYATDLELENPGPCWPPTTKYYEGVIPRFKRSYLSKETRDLQGPHREDFERIVTRQVCPQCKGGRLNDRILSCTISGKTIANCAMMEIGELSAFIRNIDHPQASTMVQALLQRLDHMVQMGLSYLSLNRETSSLSGGESQRIKMVKQLGSSLTGMTYIFDEPSIGLHPADVHQLNKQLRLLRNKGNTVLVVEHDPDVIAIADHIVEMGPHAGVDGGQVVFEGSLKKLATAGTLTGRYLFRKRSFKKEARTPADYLVIKNAGHNNLKNVSVRIPQGVVTAVTGVAGSGKSSLITHELPRLYPNIAVIDQSAIVGSKRSNTATFTGIYDSIREMFARANRVDQGWFSSNSKGACAECKGIGEITLDLAFMDSITTVCEACKGKRFNDRALGFRLHGKNIYEVLTLTVAQAADFFDHMPVVHAALARLSDVGLGYLTLGQPLSTLSGGERQRIKLSLQLDAAETVIVMDEPTTGLHMSDVDKLLTVFDRIVDSGSTLIVIEHNVDVIRNADWILELGPGAGKHGGRILFEGKPADIVHSGESVIGKFLMA